MAFSRLRLQLDERPFTIEISNLSTGTWDEVLEEATNLFDSFRIG